MGCFGSKNGWEMGQKCIFSKIDPPLLGWPSLSGISRKAKLTPSKMIRVVKDDELRGGTEHNRFSPLRPRNQPEVHG